MKVRYTYGIYIAMAALIPLHGVMACGSQTAAYTSLVYMFSHANLLHYAVNGISWLFLWKVVTPGRLLAAWSMSAMSAYLLQRHTDTPVIGWSVMIYFFLGMCLASMRRDKAVRLLLLTLIGFLLPHVAALQHLVMLVCGYVSRKVEVRWINTA